MSEQPWASADQWDPTDMSEPDVLVGDAGEAPFDVALPVIDLGDDDAPFEPDETTLVPQALVDTLPTSIDTPLTTDQARELTDTIRSTSEVLYVLLARAHAGKAYRALGYGTFAEYVQEEFAMSRSRAYQVLDQARVVAAIEAAAPTGADLPAISEAAARDLKSIIGEVVPEIKARTENLPADAAGEIVEEIVEEYRDKARDRKDNSGGDGNYGGGYEGVYDREDAAQDAADRRGFSDIPPQAPGPIVPPSMVDTFDDEEDDFDPALVRRNVQAAYDLYSSLSALKTMPDVESVINTIPVERRIQINDSLRPSLEWLAEFEAAWFAQPWQVSDNAADADEEFDPDYDPDDYDYGPEM